MADADYVDEHVVEFVPCINRLTPRPVVHRLNVFVLVAFKFLPYLEIKLTFECTAWFYGLAPPLLNKSIEQNTANGNN